MSTDRKTLLAQYFQAKAAMNNSALPPEIRVLAKTAADRSDALLGLQSALARKAARENLERQNISGPSEPLTGTRPNPIHRLRLQSCRLLERLRQTQVGRVAYAIGALAIGFGAGSLICSSLFNLGMAPIYAAEIGGIAGTIILLILDKPP